MRKFALVSVALVTVTAGGYVLVKFLGDYKFYKNVDRVRARIAELTDEAEAEGNESLSQTA